MTTISYPAKGEGGLSVAQWAQMYASQDGIINDLMATGQSAFFLTRVGDTVCRIGVGTLLVNGYVLEVTEAEDLNCPAVASTTTFYIYGVYDGALNVALPDGSANPAGPCRLQISTGAPTGAGRFYDLLYTVTRTPGQALTAATVVDYRHWNGPNITISTMPATNPTGWGPHARGTQLYVTNTRDHFVRDISGGTLIWRNLVNGPPVAFPAPAGLVSRDAAPATPQYFYVSGDMIKCRGSLERSAGTSLSTGNDVILGTFPAGSRPLFTERFVCKVGPGPTPGWTEVRVNADGAVVMTNPPAPVDWIDISPIFFRAEI